MFVRASVPTVTRIKNGRRIAAFQYFPQDDESKFDLVAVCLSNDEGNTWTTPESIEVNNMEQGLMRPFDPTLVALPDGPIRFFFTSNRDRNLSNSRDRVESGHPISRLRVSRAIRLRSVARATRRIRLTTAGRTPGT